MDWKQIIVNTVTAILVAVLSGVLVWLFTRSPETKEGLKYSISRSGGFGSGVDRLTFFKINVENKGSLKADSVNIIVSQNGSSRLAEIEARYKKPIPPGIKYTRESSRLTVFIPTFLPEDTASFALLYRGNANLPEVTIRSNNGTGILEQQTPNASSPTNRILLYISLIGFAAATFLSRSLAGKIVKTFGFRFLRSDMNNSGFLLFHAGSLDLAQQALTAAVMSGQHYPIVLSNLGAVRSYNGSPSEGRALIDSALRWAIDKHSMAVARFNSFLDRYKNNDRPGALDDLRLSLSLSKEIRNYCKNGVIVLNISAQDPEVKKLIG